MKFFFILPIIAILLISGCTSGQQSANPQPTNPTDSNPEPSVAEFSIVARQFAFEPSTITVKKGQIVRLTLTSEDTTHGFTITEYNINKVISPGEATTVEFVADKAGTFTTSCSVPCGAGHQSMKGTLIVEE